MAREPAALAGLDGYADVELLVRVHGAPIGTARVPVEGGRCTPARIAERVAGSLREELRVALAEHWVAMPPAERPALAVGPLLDAPAVAERAAPEALSVVVCTRDRPASLARCLTALERLVPAPLEILVVDNAPATDETRQLVQQRFPRVRYVVEPRPGLDWARNRGVLESRGAIVAFTDDDVLVDSGWVGALARAFAEEPGAMAVTGLVLPAELETEAQRLFEQYGGFARGYRRRVHLVPRERSHGEPWHHGAGQFGTGANMSFRRELFDRIGGFDPALDVGTATEGGGDLEYFFRTLQEGYALVYEPRAVVRHVHRRDGAGLERQIFGWGCGFRAYVERSRRAYPSERKAFRALMRWWWWTYTVRGGVGDVLRGMIPRALRWAEIRGAFGGVRAWRRAARQAADIAARFPEEPALPPAPPSASPRRGDSPPDGTAVLAVDVHAPLAPLALGDRVDAWLYALEDGVPVARCEVTGVSGTVSVTTQRSAVASAVAWRIDVTESALRELLAARLGASASHVKVPQRPASVSVVVATYDRPDDLRACLAALCAQRLDRAVEIIVVDNHPASGLTPPVVGQFPGVQLVSEPRGGLSYARNAGIRASTGEIIVTTDDDVTMPTGWLESLVAPFTRADVGMVCGNVLPRELETASQRLFERYGGLGRGFHRMEVGAEWLHASARHAPPTWQLGATANAAFRRELFTDPTIGYFDESLGAGTPTGCSEDTLHFYRTLHAGWRAVYEPTAWVWHRHRSEIGDLRKQIYAYSKGHVAYHLVTLLEDGELRALWRLLVELPAHDVRLLARWILGGRAVPLPLIVAEIGGHLTGPWALVRSRARARRLGRGAVPGIAGDLPRAVATHPFSGEANASSGMTPARG